MTAGAASTVTRWWWLRHAPVINPAGLIYGQSDITVDLSGRAALAALAARLPREAHWIATPARRTQDTAAALREAMMAASGGAPLPELPEIEPALIEQGFGDWQGRPAAEIFAEPLPPDHPFRLDPARFRPPAGESFLDLIERAGPAIERVSRDQAGRDIIAVTHGGTIRAAIALALDLAPGAALRLEVDPLSLTRLDRLGEPDGPALWRVGGINLPPSLPPAGLAG